MSDAKPGIALSEVEVLMTCALRFDGYAWCREKHLGVGRLMNAYWEPSSFAALLSRGAEYRAAVFFLQQRSYRWNDEVPEGEGLRLWRTLFLSLADLAPPPRFSLDEHSLGRWRDEFEPHLGEIKLRIAERLADDTRLFEPLIVAPIPPGAPG